MRRVGSRVRGRISSSSKDQINDSEISSRSNSRSKISGSGQ